MPDHQRHGIVDDHVVTARRVTYYIRYSHTYCIIYTYCTLHTLYTYEREATAAWLIEEAQGYLANDGATLGTRARFPNVAIRYVARWIGAPSQRRTWSVQAARSYP